MKIITYNIKCMTKTCKQEGEKYKNTDIRFLHCT